MTESFELEELLNRYAAGTCRREEFERLMFLVAKADAADTSSNHWERSWDATPSSPELSPEWRNRLASMLKDSEEDKPATAAPAIRTMYRPRKWMIAAALAFFIVSGYLIRIVANREETASSAQLVKRKASPEHEKATLTLADGRQIGLDTASLGKLAMQSGMKISKSEEGELIYYSEPEAGVSPGYNTITVPRSGNYSVVLSDGTRVHLNAASTLSFPVSFSGSTREVRLEGEGYFEVVKNPARPFHVKTDGFTVEVLGTHFDVKSYPEDGSSSATLVEGKVRVRKEGSRRSPDMLLKPSQQAELNPAGKMKRNTLSNLDEVLAWHSNTFKFANRPVSSILHDVSRWYDIPIIYHDKTPEQKLTGTFSRTTDLSQLVAMLRYAGVNVRIAPDHSMIVGE